MPASHPSVLVRLACADLQAVQPAYSVRQPDHRFFRAIDFIWSKVSCLQLLVQLSVHIWLHSANCRTAARVPAQDRVWQLMLDEYRPRMIDRFSKGEQFSDKVRK